MTIGDDLTIGDDAILFRSTVGNDVTIRPGAIVVGVTLADGVGAAARHHHHARTGRCPAVLSVIDAGVRGNGASSSKVGRPNGLPAFALSELLDLAGTGAFGADICFFGEKNYN